MIQLNLKLISQIDRKYLNIYLINLEDSFIANHSFLHFSQINDHLYEKFTSLNFMKRKQ